VQHIAPGDNNFGLLSGIAHTRRRNPDDPPGAMARVRLPERCEVACVTQLCDELRAAVLTGEVVIDAREVTAIDAVGAQLLCAAAAALRAQDRRLAWEASSPALRDAIGVLGLGAAVELPAET
jgi:hypothetical protein